MILALHRENLELVVIPTIQHTEHTNLEVLVVVDFMVALELLLAELEPAVLAT